MEVQTIKEIYKEIYSNSLIGEDTYALTLLQPLLKDGRLLPFTGASLRPLCLLHLVNDIVINHRRKILEFGSGISTIIIGRLIKFNGLKSRVISIEHDASWVAEMRDLITLENLEEVVRIVHAPLISTQQTFPTNQWYDTSIIDRELNGVFDMVIIDGPPAWETQKKEARYQALPFVFPRLAQKSIVYLDDANRKGEQKIINRWEKEFNIKFKTTGSRLAYFTQGENFYAEPIPSYGK
jgi:predicted O-methyltransferase YrrM